MQKKILITGGAGHIGGSLAQRLVKNPDNHVVVVDNLLTGSLSHLPKQSLPNFKFIQADVNKHEEIRSVFSSEHFDYIFHYAAVVGVDRTLAHPLMVLDDIEGIKNVLNLARITKVKRVFFSSSSEVYGEPLETPQREETTPINAKLPYAIVKCLAETYLRAYQVEYGIGYIIFRFFNTYGPLQSEDFVIPRFIKNALRNEDIVLFGDGSQTRTFCYIDDNIDATEKALENEACIDMVINIGSDVPVSMIDLAKLVIHASGSKSRIVFVPARVEGEVSSRKPDLSRMKNVLGQKDSVSLEEGISRMINFYKGTGSFLQTLV